MLKEKTMSAKIPDTMLLSDLLKATGYDCPEEMQGRTFAEATAGGDVEVNKAVTIDVSSYTEPVVIKPDTDYESMKQITASLSNIPAVKTEENLSVTENGEYTPEEGKVYKKVTVNVPQGTTGMYGWNVSSAYMYTKTAQPEVGDPAYLISNGKINPTTQTITEVGVDFSYLKIGTDVEIPRASASDIIF